MKYMYISPLPDFGYEFPIEEIILGIKKTTTRKKTNHYPIGEQRELAHRVYDSRKGMIPRSYGVVIEIEDVELINTAEITEEFALNDGIHPTNGRSAKDNLLEIFKYFYKHVPKEMVAVHLKFVGYTNEVNKDYWEKRVEHYRQHL